MRLQAELYNVTMTRYLFAIGAVAFTIGAGLGSLFTYSLMSSNNSSNATHPFAMTDEEREVAQAQTDLLKAATLLRGVAQGIIWKHGDTEDWLLPESEHDLIEQLVADNVFDREYFDTWPGSDRRPAGEPPFYIVGTTEAVAHVDGNTVLLYEHPAHHPGGGGSIVYANTHTETLERDAFAAVIAAFESG